MMPTAIIPGRAVSWRWDRGPFAGEHHGVFLGWGPYGTLAIRSGPYLFDVEPQAILPSRGLR